MICSVFHFASRGSFTVTQQKNKFLIVQRKSPRTWNVVGDKSFDDLSNFQVCAVQYIVSELFVEAFYATLQFCMKTPCGAPT